MKPLITLRYGAGIRTVETFKGEVVDRNRLSKEQDRKLGRLVKDLLKVRH